jgi:flagellar biosynthetic protein FliP
VPDPLTLNFQGITDESEQVALGLKILALLTVLSLVPSILMMVTSFTRIVVVLSFVRRAIGVNEVPPTPVILGLALFLTFFVMAPILTQLNDSALQPYLQEEIGGREALDKAEVPLRDFMLEQTRKKDLALFVRLSRIDPPQTAEDLPFHVLVPSFMISELKTAFTIGFMIYLPFLVIDMVVSSILLSMGMLMLPPILISLPFKVILFVLVDGWNLVVGSLVAGYM